MEERRGERLSWEQRSFLALLGVPALGLAFTITVVSTYVPVLVEQISGPLLVGVLVGGEGFFGIFMPAIVGGFSDRTSRTVRHRLRLLVGCASLMIAAVAGVGVLGLLGVGSLWNIGLALALLYIGYYACLAPYWALYPDLVPHGQSGRSRSAESTWRVTGVGLSLIGGGLLLDVSPGLPFFTAGLIATATVAVLAWGLRGRYDDPVEATGDRSGHSFGSVRDLLRVREIRMLVIANALWNFALSALRAFVVLFFVTGMDRSASFVATAIFPLVAVGIAIAAPLSGWVADRAGHVRLLTGALVVYGGLMIVPGFSQASWLVVIIPFGAAGAATVMTLPFSVLMRLLPQEHHGAGSGLFGLSRGVGGVLGPLVAGAAILLAEPVMGDTHGYAAMWFVCAAALALSLPFLRALRYDSRL